MYENDWSGLLLPNQPDRAGTFMGEGSAVAPATNEHLTMMFEAISNETRQIRAMINAFSALAPFTAPPPQMSYPTTQPIQPRVVAPNRGFASPPRDHVLSAANSHAAPPRPLLTPIAYPPASSSPVLPQEPYFCIPVVPIRLPNGNKSPRSESWRIIVQHCYEGDPSRGLPKPFKDWPAHWYQGPNHRFAVQRGERLMIGTEFVEVYNRDEGKFLAAYPEALKGHTSLYRAICKARTARNDRQVRGPRVKRTTS
uniref:Uncharacterized protein n=1 Tax=Mycena chlorophos TaxID=658473 RepID=A0ABQ0KX54_MYCCL|nr:predicted protein [Mycena chlorophos]